MERYNIAVNSGSLLFSHDISLAAFPAPIFGQELRNPLRSLGQVPLDPTPEVLNANSYTGPNDIQLTQDSCAPGTVDNSLTWARTSDLLPHLDYSINYVSIMLVSCSHTLVSIAYVLSFEAPPLTHGLTGGS